MNAVESQINLMYFLFNHPPIGHVMNGVWGEDGLVGHFGGKFMDIYSKSDVHNSSQAMIKFFMELSQDNQRKLLGWINENYDSKSY